MKYILSLFFLFVFQHSFGQITLVELTRIYNMDSDTFESYAISKGYTFAKFDKDNDVSGILYVKGFSKQTKYLHYYDKWFDLGKYVKFQTSNTSEVLSLKSQLKNSNFKLIKSYFMDNGTKVEEYKNNTLNLEIFTDPPATENDFVAYEVGFYKR